MLATEVPADLLVGMLFAVHGVAGWGPTGWVRAARRLALSLALLLLPAISAACSDFRLDDPLGEKAAAREDQNWNCARLVSLTAIASFRQLGCPSSTAANDCARLSWVASNSLYVCTGDDSEIF